MSFYDRELEDILQRERIKRARRRRCQETGCIRAARTVERDWQGRDWRFCTRHGTARAAHNRIVNRILSIPPR